MQFNMILCVMVVYFLVMVCLSDYYYNHGYKYFSFFMLIHPVFFALGFVIGHAMGVC